MSPEYLCSHPFVISCVFSGNQNYIELNFLGNRDETNYCALYCPRNIFARILLSYLVSSMETRIILNSTFLETVTKQINVLYSSPGISFITSFSNKNIYCNISFSFSFFFFKKKRLCARYVARRKKKWLHSRHFPKNEKYSKWYKKKYKNMLFS